MAACGVSLLLILVSATEARSQADAKGSPTLPPGAVVMAPASTYVSPLWDSVTEGKTQADALVSPSFPMGGLLGENPFQAVLGAISGLQS